MFVSRNTSTRLPAHRRTGSPAYRLTGSRGEDMNRARRSEPDHMRHADLRAFDLARAGLTAQVRDDLVDVGDASGAERMALRQEAAADVHWRAAAVLEPALVDGAPGLALAAQAEIFVVQ